MGKKLKGNVYLLCDANSNLYKIGVTRGDVENRVKKLQTGNGNEIHVVYTIETDYPFAMETMLHSRFFPKKRLNEWFELSNDDVVNFGKYCEQCRKNISVLSENPFFSGK